MFKKRISLTPIDIGLAWKGVMYAKTRLKHESLFVLPKNSIDYFLFRLSMDLKRFVAKNNVDIGYPHLSLAHQ